MSNGESPKTSVPDWNPVLTAQGIGLGCWYNYKHIVVNPGCEFLGRLGIKEDSELSVFALGRGDHELCQSVFRSIGRSRSIILYADVDWGYASRVYQ